MQIEAFYLACAVWGVGLSILVSRDVISIANVVSGIMLTGMTALSVYFLPPYLPTEIAQQFEPIGWTVVLVLMFAGPFLSKGMEPDETTTPTEPTAKDACNK